MAKRYIIIGDGAAGTTAAQTIRQRDPHGMIEIYSDDPHPAYYRAALTNYLVGELREAEIWAVPPYFYEQFNVQRKLARVASVDTALRQITLTSGVTVPYDRLIIAAGASARKPPFAGSRLPGVMVMRTLQDVRQVMDLIKLRGLKEAVIVGGGPLAMEWVVGLHERGVKVHYLLRGNHLMRRTLDKTASDLTLARMRLAGVDVRTNCEIAEALPDTDGSVRAVKLKSGETLTCELVGVAIGVVCNSGFLANSGINLHEKHRAIIVDHRMRTNAKYVYAAGDIVALDDEVLQLWEPARLQGRTAGINCTGGDATYHIGAHYNATRLYDLDFASVGDIRERDGVKTRVEMPQGGGRVAYRKLFLKDNRLVGAVLLGERREKVRRRGRVYKRMIDEKIDVRELPESALLDSQFDLTGWLNQKSILNRPKSPIHQNQPKPAQMRGTMMMKNPTAASVPTPTRKKRPMTATGLQAAPRLKAALAKNDNSFLQLNGTQIALENQSISIGSGQDENDVVLKDSAVSHIHALLMRHGATWYVRDAGSRNGTWVNGQQVSVPVALRSGDRLELGQTVLLFHHDQQAQQIVKPPPPVKVPKTYHLQVMTGNHSGQEWVLIDRQRIGRSADCTFVLTDSLVSGRHVEIELRDGDGIPRVFVRDLGSSNGTRYNDNVLSVRWQEMSPDDTLTLANMVTLILKKG